jgi:hypothetical protein
MVAKRSSRVTMAATVTVGTSELGAAIRIVPKISTAPQTAPKAIRLLRVRRRSKPCSQSALVVDANHPIRKVRPHMPVTETSWTSGAMLAWV